MSKTKEQKERAAYLEKARQSMQRHRAIVRKLTARGVSNEQIAVCLKRKAKKAGAPIQVSGDALTDAIREMNRLYYRYYRLRKKLGAEKHEYDLRKTSATNGVRPGAWKSTSSAYLTTRYGASVKRIKPSDPLTRVKRIIGNLKKSIKELENMSCKNNGA